MCVCVPMGQARTNSAVFAVVCVCARGGDVKRNCILKFNEKLFVDGGGGALRDFTYIQKILRRPP